MRSKPDGGKGKGQDGKKDPPGIERRMWDKVAEDDRYEESTDCSQREHHASRGADVLMLDVADSGGHRQPCRETEDEEEADSDSECP